MSANKANRDGVLLQLEEILNSCCKSIGPADFANLVKFLDSISGTAASEPENEDAQSNAFNVIKFVYDFLYSSTIAQDIFDSISSDLLRSYAKFAGFSAGCFEYADKITILLADRCSPRQTLLTLSEALDCSNNDTVAYVAVLLGGISRVIRSTWNCDFETLKVTIPTIVKAVKQSSRTDYPKETNTLPKEDKDTDETDSEPDENEDSETDLEPDENDDTELQCTLFDRVNAIADSINSSEEISQNENLRALLGLFVLNILALVSVRRHHLRFSVHLASILSNKGVSCLTLITGYVETMSRIVFGENEEVCASFLSHAYIGSALSVIWANSYDGFAEAAKFDMKAITTQLQSERGIRQQTIGIFKNMFLSDDVADRYKLIALQFLKGIMKDIYSSKCLDEHNDCHLYLDGFVAAFEAIAKYIIRDDFARKAYLNCWRNGNNDAKGACEESIVLSL